jgi:hypothetical protein
MSPPYPNRRRWRWPGWAFCGSSAAENNLRSHASALLLTAHEPETVGVPEDEAITTTLQRGSLAPQRGEGSRVRGEIG